MHNSSNPPGANSPMGGVTGTNVNVGLGYGLVIAVGVLVLLSTLMLASYVCVKVHSARLSRTLAGRGGVEAQQQQYQGGVEQSGMHLSMGGLDQSTLDTYPIVPFTPQSTLQDNACSICLSDYKSSDVLRYLPDCLHSFHASCVDPWLRMHASCPMCRTSPFPTPQTTPGSTPLSELIPLAIRPLRNR